MTLLGLDLGGSHATCSLIDGRALIDSEQLELGNTSSFAGVEPQLRATLQRLALRSGNPVTGLGIGFAGLADFRSNRVLSTNGKYEDAPSFDFNGWSLAAFGVPARVENDARLALRGEMFAGSAQGGKDVVMFTLGTGIGGVVAVNGEPFLGARGRSGVLGGHVAVRQGGRRCTCGGVGCAEAEASGWALPDICREWPGFASSRLAASDLDFKSLFEAAKVGDNVANAIADHCIDIWSMMTATSVHLFDPDIVVFGGGVMGAADLILPRIREYVRKHTWTRWDGPILPAALGSEAAALGVPTLFAGESHVR